MEEVKYATKNDASKFSRGYSAFHLEPLYLGRYSLSVIYWNEIGSDVLSSISHFNLTLNKLRSGAG